MTDDPDHPREGLDFSTVIASTVHDMKNSLAMLMQAYGESLASLPDELSGSREHGVIEYESLRLNGMLVQMLGLYKLQVNQLPLRPAWIEMDDFLEAQLARHDNILRARHIEAVTRSRKKACSATSMQSWSARWWQT